jgi:hypothetical protein
MDAPRWFPTCCLAALAACAAPPNFLPNDETFLAPVVAQCLIQQPDAPDMGYPCCQALAFFATGEATRLSGQEEFPGHYELDGEIANGVLFGSSFSFDLTTNIATGAALMAGPWVADTTNLLSVACQQ